MKNNWKTIDTAPENEPVIILANGVVQHLLPYKYYGVWYSSEDNSELSNFEPTHWQPLPEAP